MLVGAECRWVSGEETEAIGLYERAIAAGRERGFSLHTAIACERAGLLHLERGRPALATFYLQEAHEICVQWGSHSGRPPHPRAVCRSHGEATGAGASPDPAQPLAD